MARPIRSLTEARGHATSKHVYVLYTGFQQHHLTRLAGLQVLAVQAANTHAKSRVF